MMTMAFAAGCMLDIAPASLVVPCERGTRESELLRVCAEGREFVLGGEVGDLVRRAGSGDALCACLVFPLLS